MRHLCVLFLVSILAAPARPQTASASDLTNNGILASSSCRLARLTASPNPDLICAVSNTITIQPGNGDGTFQPPTSTPLPSSSTATTPGSPTIAAIGDVNNDGIPDLIVTDSPTAQDLVLLSDGTGHAAISAIIEDETHPTTALLRDINGDGNPDLITEDAAGDATIFLGHGNGTFTPGTLCASCAAAINTTTSEDTPLASHLTTPPLQKPGSRATTLAPTITTLSINPTSAYQNQTVTFTTQVTANSGIPTGTVTIYQGSNVLATIHLAAGSGSYATALLAVSSYTFTALYSGDANFQSSVSQPVNVTVQASNFTIALNQPTVTLVTGHHTTLQLTATSVGAFSGPLRLNIGYLPEYATATFTPVTLQLTAGSTATSSLYLDTNVILGLYSRSSHPKPLNLYPKTLAALAILIVPFGLSHRRTQTCKLAILLGIVVLLGTIGCSGKYPNTTPPGTYTLQITATSTQTGVAQTINLPLTVTQ